MIDTIQKRCFMGAVGLHGLLFLILIFGSAFFVAHQPARDYSTLKVIPSRFVEGLSGGGGNPNIPVTNEQKKGDPNAETEAPKPLPTPPKPPEVKKIEPPTPKPVEKPPEVVKTSVPKIKDDILLKPTTRTKVPDKSKVDEAKAAKAAKEAAAKAKAEAEAKATRDAAAKFASHLDKSVAGLSRGFAQGTAVDVGGPGGEAYADYAQFVKQMYDDAWVVMSDLTIEQGMAVVKVTIARDGHVIRAVIIERSGERQLDLSVQNALDKVKKLPPFPAEVKDAQRSFTIEFNLKAKRSAA